MGWGGGVTVGGVGGSAFWTLWITLLLPFNV